MGTGKRERELANLLSGDACGADGRHVRARAPTISYEAGAATRRWSSATHEACWSPPKRKPSLAVRVGPEVLACVAPDNTPPPPPPPEPKPEPEPAVEAAVGVEVERPPPPPPLKKRLLGNIYDKNGLICANASWRRPRPLPRADFQQWQEVVAS